MPMTAVWFYRESEDDVPVLRWLQALRRRDRKAYAKCVARIQRLAELGHELRRPEADLLRDGIHELRIRRGRVHYRLLYFHFGQEAVILVHGLTKEGRVPGSEIARALRRKQALEQNPKAHIFEAPHG